MALAAFAAFAFSCKGPSVNSIAEDTQAAERRRAVLADLGTNVVRPAYVEFDAAAADLKVAVDEWAASGDDADRETAQQAWRDAMLEWQVAEVYQFGPSGAMGIVPGGEDLRDEIYSWPTTNHCRIAQELVEQAYDDPNTFADEAVNVRGLDALEYLLFYEGTENTCDPARSINADGSWMALDADELDARRAAYAATVAAGVETSAGALLEAWDAFESNLGNAGTSSELYPSTHEALNSVSDALFYIESEVKDMKLGEPAGLVNCVEAVCPEQREFKYSSMNFAAIGANIEGFQLLFTGGEGLGFDDLLVDSGQEALVTELTQHIAEARSAVDIETDMASALQGDTTPIRDAHAAVKRVTDVLKTQFVSVLDLELPDRAEGDND